MTLIGRRCKDGDVKAERYELPETFFRVSPAFPAPGRPALTLPAVPSPFGGRVPVLPVRYVTHTGAASLRKDIPRERRPGDIQVVIAAGFHLFPFRTEKLSPPAPMVLQCNAGE